MRVILQYEPITTDPDTSLQDKESTLYLYYYFYMSLEKDPRAFFKVFHVLEPTIHTNKYTILIL